MPDTTPEVTFEEFEPLSVRNSCPNCDLPWYKDSAYCVDHRQRESPLPAHTTPGGLRNFRDRLVDFLGAQPDITYPVETYDDIDLSRFTARMMGLQLHGSHVEKVERERDELRAALQSIANGPYDDDDLDEIERMRGLALDALERTHA